MALAAAASPGGRTCNPGTPTGASNEGPPPGAFPRAPVPTDDVPRVPAGSPATPLVFHAGSVVHTPLPIGPAAASSLPISPTGPPSASAGVGVRERAFEREAEGAAPVAPGTPSFTSVGERPRTRAASAGCCPPPRPPTSHPPARCPWSGRHARQVRVRRLPRRLRCGTTSYRRTPLRRQSLELRPELHQQQHPWSWGRAADPRMAGSGWFVLPPETKGGSNEGSGGQRRWRRRQETKLPQRDPRPVILTTAWLSEMGRC